MMTTLFSARLVKGALLLALTRAASSVAQAGTTNIPVTNFSFESPALNGAQYSTFITGWTPSNSAGVQSQSAFPSLYPAGIPDGNQYAYLNGTGSIFQDVGATLTAGNTYTLTAYLGVRTDEAGVLGSVNLETSGGTLLAGTGPVGSPAGTFTPYTVTFTSTAADPNLGQGLRILLSNNTGAQVNFDFVRLTQSAPSPVPEASTTVSLGLLLALGMGAMVIAAKKRRKA